MPFPDVCVRQRSLGKVRSETNAAKRTVYSLSLMLNMMLKSMLTCSKVSHRASAFFAAGSGLMDIGVGAFIFSSGISSKPAPLSASVKLYKGFMSSLQRNSLLIVLGEPCLLHIKSEVMSCKLMLLQQRKLTLAGSVYVHTSFTMHHSDH